MHCLAGAKLLTPSVGSLLEIGVPLSRESTEA